MQIVLPICLLFGFTLKCFVFPFLKLVAHDLKAATRSFTAYSRTRFGVRKTQAILTCVAGSICFLITNLFLKSISEALLWPERTAWRAMFHVFLSAAHQSRNTLDCFPVGHRRMVLHFGRYGVSVVTSIVFFSVFNLAAVMFSRFCNVFLLVSRAFSFSESSPRSVMPTREDVYD